MTVWCTGQLDVRSDATATVVVAVGVCMPVGVGFVLACWVGAGWDEEGLDDGVLPQAEIRNRRQQAMSRDQGFFDCAMNISIPFFVQVEVFYVVLVGIYQLPVRKDVN